jgi:tetratricopeptide (TPR) repeat protein
VVALLAVWFLLWMILTGISEGLIGSLLFAFGWVLVALSQFVAILVHELGHATMTVALRQRLLGVVVGTGRRLVAWTWCGVPLEIRRLPFGGMTYVAHTSRRWLRVREMLVVAAGPAVTLGWFVLMFQLVYGEGRFPERFQMPTHEATEVLGWFLVWIPAGMLVQALWPHRFHMDGQILMSDGLRLVRAPFLKSTEIEDMLAAGYVMEAELLRQRGDVKAAQRVCQQGLAQFPDKWVLYLAAGWCYLHNNAGEARRYWMQGLETSKLPTDARLLLLDALAYIPLYTGMKEFLEDAERWSKLALETAPESVTLKGTRGAVLLELGQTDEGVALLQKCLEEGKTKTDRAISASFLALAAGRRGELEKAGELLRNAKSFDPDCIVLPRISEEIARHRG